MKIYVVSHKPCDNILPADYEYIQVGALGKEHFYPLTDDIGLDNISALNYKYCELTALYWIWKNDKENDIVGLAHYRRFFTQNRFSSSINNYISSSDVKKTLLKYDIIATKPYLTSSDVRHHFEESVRGKDIDVLRDVLTNMYPDYLYSFDDVMQSHETYLLNMFVCKKKQMVSYCEWLFPLLDAVDKRIDMTGYSTQEMRLLGYLSEFLFTVYIKHNKLKVKSYSVHIVGLSKWKQIIDKIKRIIGSIIRY